MAKTAKTPGKITVRAVKTAPTPIQDAPAEELPDVITQLDALNQGDTEVEWDIRVYLAGPMGQGVRQPQQFLFNVERSDLAQLESQLAELYAGGGSFRVMCRANGHLVKVFTLNIAPRPGYRPPPPPHVQALRDAQALPPAPPPNSDMGNLMLMMMQQMKESADMTRALLERIATQPPAQQVDPLASFGMIADAFSKYQNLMPKSEADTGLKMFEKGMDLAMRISDGASKGGSTFMDVVREAIASPAIKSVIEAAATGVAGQAQQQGAHPPLPRPQQVPTFSATPAAPPPPAAFDSSNPAAVNAIEMLIGQAQTGAQPELLADNVLAMLPGAVLDALEEQDDVVAYLESLFPQITPHRDWFVRLTAAMFEPEQTEAGTFNAGPNRTAQPQV